VEAPVPRPLARLRGTLDQLLADPALAVDEHCWVQATLTDAIRPAQPMERLRRRFAHALVLVFEPDAQLPSAVPAAEPGVRSDHAIALDFVRDLRGTPATAAESALLQDACDACCDDLDVDTLLTGAGGGGR
jgi:exonuclease SbcD